jgi:hypothetical protein
MMMISSCRVGHGGCRCSMVRYNVRRRASQVVRRQVPDQIRPDPLHGTGTMFAKLTAGIA